jgi:hypothetical protein
VRTLFAALVAVLCLRATAATAAEPAELFRAGVAVKVITPPEPIWMAGYAGRNKPAEGKQHDLFVKALALDDPAGNTFVLLTSDLLAVPRSLSEAVCGEVMRLTNLPRERLMLTVSHTHCGPVLHSALNDMYPLTPDQPAKIAAYTEQLRGWMVQTVMAALADRKPAKLAYGSGEAHFAINRRQNTEKGFIIGRDPAGPVDHSVPVLRVTDADDKLRAAVFGYACHNTTLDYYRWCGDYAGFTQLAVEAKHPGAVAMFWTGCGADANPDPRRTLELAEKHGKELADAVEDVLAKPLTPISGTCAARYATIPLALDHQPTKVQLQADLLSKQHALRQRAERFLKVLDSGGRLPTEYAQYPVQVWRLGDGPLWVALGGEVVVDYDLRLRKELAGSRPVRVAGYANDVMAYIPSERVLKEGGYEADFSMVYYGHPGRWAPGLEGKIVAKVHELAREVAKK